MRQGVVDLRDFYASALGRAARKAIGRKIGETWGDGAGLDMLGVGYATPFLAGFGKARRIVAAMPAEQGVEAWPAGERNRACLVDEAALPMANALFDRVLAVHALEESDSPLALLLEIGRVLAPSGRVILAVAARHGPWAGAERTPFGHGRPFSRRQLERLVEEAGLAPVGCVGALFVPPAPWAARWADGFERAGARLWPPLARVTLLEAIKQTLAVHAPRARARAAPTPLLRPAPIGGRPAFREPPLPAGRARTAPPPRARLRWG
ncbi:MAG: methyltransferase domain-containing protein [Caulobacteraceae bacterium]